MIGIGCDIVALERIASLIKKKGYERLLTKQEQSLCESYQGHRLVEWVAGRFAAKEAIIKAMVNERELLLSDVEILYQGKQPSCRIDGYRIHISIAHELEYAIAYAMVERMDG